MVKEKKLDCCNGLGMTSSPLFTRREVKYVEIQSNQSVHCRGFQQARSHPKGAGRPRHPRNDVLFESRGERLSGRSQVSAYRQIASVPQKRGSPPSNEPTLPSSISLDSDYPSWYHAANETEVRMSPSNEPSQE